MKNRTQPRNIYTVSELFLSQLIVLSLTSLSLAQLDDRGNVYELSSNSANEPFVPVVTLKEESESQISRTFTGTVVAKRSSELGFKRIGRIESIAVDQGQRVKKGQVLAVLDSATLRAETKVLEAQSAAAQALLDELIAGPRIQTVDAARAELSEAQAMRDLMKSTFDRRQGLANSDAISRQDIDDARHQLSAAEAKVNAQRQVLAELQAGTRDEKISAQRAELLRLSASMRSLEIQIEESELLAPYDGVVARRFIDEGAIVQPGVPILRILETTPLEAWIGVPIETIGSLELGGTYEFTTNDGLRTGTLTAVLPELDNATRTQTVIFELHAAASPSDRPDTSLSQLAVGQIIQLNLNQTVPTQGFWIPLQSLVRGVRGLWSVYKVVTSTDASGSETSVVQRCDIEVLQIDINRVLVTGTISAGDRIVTSGVQKLTSGQSVNVSKPTLANGTSSNAPVEDSGE